MNTKKIVRDAVILCVMTLVCGFGLGVVHEVTLEPIAQANYNAQQAAYRNVFPEATSFADLEGFDSAEATAVAVAASDELAADTVDACVEALDANGQVLGYVINATDPSSYGGDVTLSLGVTLDGIVNGYSITEINDTAGLGMKAREEAFSSQYANKAIPEGGFVVTKTGATSDAEIDAISGATISSNAVTRAVNTALAYYGSLVE